MKIIQFFKNAFSDMKASARAQHEVDRAEFTLAKTEARANFEENRGKNSFRRAKENARASWDAAHMTPAERAEAEQKKRDARIAEAEAGIASANARIEAARNGR